MIPNIDRRRGLPRVLFDQGVEVFAPDSQQAVSGRAANLSEGGMFVASQRLFGLGTEIGVRVPLGPGEGPMAFRGRVVRISDGAQSGMAIAFDELADNESAALRRALLGEATTATVREAKVWFAGTTQPTRVQARLGPEGLRLFCDLGFLRLGVPATLFFPDEEDTSYTGVLQAASLHVDPDQGVPRLELAMSIEELPDASQTWTYWPPPPIAAARSEGAAFDAAAPFVELAPAAEPTAPGVPATEELVIESAARETDEPVIALTGGRSPQLDDDAALRPVAGSIEAQLLPSPELSAEPSVQVPSRSRLEPDLDPPAEAGREWDLGSLDAAEQSQWSLHAEDVPAARPRRQRGARVWLWLLALCMAGLTVASMTYTNVWQRVSDKLLTPRRRAQLGSLLHGMSPAVVPASQAGDPADPRDAPATDEAAGEVHGAAAGTPEAPGGEASGASASATTVDEAGAAPALEPDTSTLIIPIEGSVSGARHYLLAKPDGVAVNLPHARPKVRFGDYQVQRGGFRVVWIRRRAQGGLHLRVLHEPGSTAVVELSRSAVRVTLKPLAPADPVAPSPDEGSETP